MEASPGKMVFFSWIKGLVAQVSVEAQAGRS